MTKKQMLIKHTLEMQGKILHYKTDIYYYSYLSDPDKINWKEEQSLGALSSDKIEDYKEYIEEVYRKITLIEILRNSDGGMWFGESRGYGAWSTIYLLSNDGLYTGGIQTGPLYYECSMTEEEYLLAKNELEKNNHEIIDEDYRNEDDPLIMVKHGCKPGITYYLLGHDLRYPGYYLEYDNDFESILDSLEFELIENWVDMDIEELEEWIEVACQIEKGINSYYND